MKPTPDIRRIIFPVNPGFAGEVKVAGNKGRGSLLAEDDSAAGEVVGGEFDFDFVAGEDADEMLAHFAGDVTEDLAACAALLKAELEHGIGQCGGNGGFDFDRL